jgi:hypothetical protein
VNGVHLLASAKIGEAAATVLASNTPIAVIDDHGKAIGAVDREMMIKALYPEHRK